MSSKSFILLPFLDINVFTHLFYAILLSYTRSTRSIHAVSSSLISENLSKNRVVARNNSVLKQLVLEAKKLYEADAEHRVNIYFADAHSSWRWTDSRTKRPLSSIVLNKGVKEMLLDDAKDFLKVCLLFIQTILRFWMAGFFDGMADALFTS